MMQAFMIGGCTFRTRAHRFGTGNTQKSLGLILMWSLSGDKVEVFVCISHYSYGKMTFHQDSE